MKQTILLTTFLTFFSLECMGASTVRKGFMLNPYRSETQLQQDIDRLANLGANIVRWQISFYANPSVSYWLEKTDKVLGYCESRSMVLVIDFHYPTPGVKDFRIDNEADFVAKWRVFAERFKNRGKLWYDLANEPKNTNWRSIALNAARAIRSIDKRHPIVYTPRIGTSTPLMRSVRPLPGIRRQILQIHFYDFPRIQDPEGKIEPHNLKGYPSSGRTKATLRRRLGYLRDAELRTGCRVFIGEVAIDRNHRNIARFFKDFLSITDEYGIDVTLHAYREAFHWNYEGTPAWRRITNWLRR